MGKSFDWEVLHQCTYPVPDSGAYESGYEGDCGEPAIIRVWWDSDDDSMLVCAPHFAKIIEDALAARVEELQSLLAEALEYIQDPDDYSPYERGSLENKIEEALHGH